MSQKSGDTYLCFTCIQEKHKKQISAEIFYIYSSSVLVCVKNKSRNHVLYFYIQLINALKTQK